MAERNAPVGADKRIEFRIGINMGDIVVEDGDIFGDGVNVAARLEALTEPGGICVSARVKEDAIGRLDLAFEDLGEQALKNIARPVRAYKIATDAVSATARETPAPALPDKPSIAVLPFQNMTGDAEQEYFVDGMVEEIITALSRIRWLFVIARNSSFTYKDQKVDVKRIGRELGVRYVLETAAGLSQRAGAGLDSHPCQAPGRWCRRRGGAQTPQAQDQLEARRLWFAVARDGVSCEFPTGRRPTRPVRERADIRDELWRESVAFSC